MGNRTGATMSRHYAVWDEPDTDPDAPDPSQQALIDEFYDNLFYTPELTPPPHLEEAQ
jgi:hypothetical protein